MKRVLLLVLSLLFLALLVSLPFLAYAIYRQVTAWPES